MGGTERDRSAAMTGRTKGRAVLYERADTPSLTFEGDTFDGDGEKTAARVSNPAMVMNYSTRVIARDLQDAMKHAYDV